jgi:hypothetical protein
MTMPTEPIDPATAPAVPATPALAEAPPTPVPVATTPAAAASPARPVDPAVLEARAAVDAARGDLVADVGQLKASARNAVDPRVRIQRVARDPKRLIPFVGVGTAAIVGIRLLSRRRGRITPGTLPPEVVAALDEAGVGGPKVREALDASFTKYLVDRGATPPGRRVPPAVVAAIVSVAGVAAREGVRRYMRRGTDEAR